MCHNEACHVSSESLRLVGGVGGQPICLAATRTLCSAVSNSSARLWLAATTQGLTLVHVRAQLEQLQDTFMI